MKGKYPLNKGVEQDNDLTHSNGQQEGGKINDDLRYLIIEQVAERPAIWDHGREPKCLGQRKDHFIEIAALLSTENNVLTCYDIEKQWKNLKDTYIKTRKKLVTDESGCVVPPRWKFYSAMMFLDQIGTEPNTPTSSNSLTILGKRNSRSSRLSVRKHSVPDIPSEARNKTSKSCPLTKPLTEFRTYPEDECTAFCNSLIYPLREIGSINRLELLKLQKEIQDTIHAKRMALLQANSH
ncbi:unnamed protein product [Enterobius vermicularis]|uniref:MADF domain-containing protein n=1 Tax=Enterobius vermicularis TaxID=51028 RepID=A0A0N4VJ83_ENTVE|nr:unnamed protein product [Enterobius vermicularis]